MKRRFIASLALLAAFVGVVVGVRADRRGQLMLGGAAEPWSPLSLSGMVAWYQADDLITSSNLADGASVTAWSDRSGNGNTITNPVATKQPIVKTNLYNGKHVVVFDGSNDFLNDVTPTGYSGENGQTIFVAARWAAGAGGSFGNLVCTKAAGNELRLTAGEDTASAIFCGGLYTAGVGSGSSTNCYYLAHFDDAANETTLHKNFNQQTAGPGTETGAFSSDVIRLGSRSDGSLPFNGRINEVIIYNRRLTTDERLLVWLYASNRFGW